MTGTCTERRRSPRWAANSKATVLWLDGDESYTLRGHLHDVSADGCSVVTLTRIPAPIGAIGAPELGIMTRFQVTHCRRDRLMQVTGLRFLASLPVE